MHYTLEGARSILRDGKPFVTIQLSRNPYGVGGWNYPPDDADQLARWVVDMLNVTDDALAAFREMRKALADHLQKEAERTGVPVETVCPCATTTLRAADAAILLLHHAGGRARDIRVEVDPAMPKDEARLETERDSITIENLGPADLFRREHEQQMMAANARICDKVTDLRGFEVRGRCQKEVPYRVGSLAHMGRFRPCNRYGVARCWWSEKNDRLGTTRTPSVVRCEAHKVEVGQEITW